MYKCSYCNLKGSVSEILEHEKKIHKTEMLKL